MNAPKLVRELLDKVYHWHRKHRLKRFYKRFPWNAKYETIWSWLVSFITLYTLLEVKS